MKSFLSLLVTCMTMTAAEFDFHTYWRILPTRGDISSVYGLPIARNDNYAYFLTDQSLDESGKWLGRLIKTDSALKVLVSERFVLPIPLDEGNGGQLLSVEDSMVQIVDSGVTFGGDLLLEFRVTTNSARRSDWFIQRFTFSNQEWRISTISSSPSTNQSQYLYTSEFEDYYVIRSIGRASSDDVDSMFLNGESLGRVANQNYDNSDNGRGVLSGSREIILPDDFYSRQSTYIRTFHTLKGLKNGAVAAGEALTDAESGERRVNGQDIFIQTLRRDGVPPMLKRYGYSGDERLIDLRVVSKNKAVLAAKSDSPELQSQATSGKPWVVWIFVVDLESGALLSECVLPYPADGWFGNPTGEASSTFNLRTGAQYRLFIQHMLRVTTFSPIRTPYSVSESSNLYDWIPIRENIRDSIQWDIPILGQQGYLRIEE